MFLNPFHCTGAIDSSGTVITSSGRYSYTVTQIVSGHWEIVFNTEHANANPIVLLGACVPASRLYMNGLATSTGFKLYHRDYQYSICNSDWNFSVLA